MLDVQHKFVLDLLDVTKPVTEKVVAQKPATGVRKVTKAPARKRADAACASRPTTASGPVSPRPAQPQTQPDCPPVSAGLPRGPLAGPLWSFCRASGVRRRANPDVSCRDSPSVRVE